MTDPAAENQEPPLATKSDVETATLTILDAVARSQVATVKSVQAMREQNSNEHSRMQRIVEWMYDQTTSLMRRFGFLVDKNAPEPPIPPTAKKGPDA